MDFLTDLWLPLLVSAVFVFVASSILHMVLPIHRGDYAKMPAEEAVLATMRQSGVRPGAYMFPCPGSMKEMRSPAMIAKYRQGPVGFLTVLPDGAPAIAKSLVQWFGYCLAVSIMTAYIAHLSLPAGEPGPRVFRVTGAIALLGFGVSNVVDSIWKGQCWSTTAKFVFDGLVYALVAAATFTWLWP